MLSSRHLNASYAASPKHFPHSARNLQRPLKTEGDEQYERSEQQNRISRILSEIRHGGPLSPNAVLLPQSEFNRMRHSAVILTREEIEQQKKILEEQNEKQQAVAKSKKQKMLDIEAERKKLVPPSEVEIERRMISEGIKDRANYLLNEEKDDVKQMNQMMLYAKMVTVRDNQLREKRDIQDYSKREEKRKDLGMEIDRLQKIKFYEEQDRVRRELQKKSALETVKQMHEREAERKRQQEARDKEGQEMLRRIFEIQQEDSKNNLEKKQHQKELLDKIVIENQNAIAKKYDKVRLEKEEEEKIAKYLIEKAKKEAEYQAEQKRIQDEKEKEIHRLRTLQEKHSDRQAEIDALRAKRANEGADRLARVKERKEAERKARINQELLESRQLQSLQKAQRIQEQAKAERDEFQRIVETQKIERELELRMEHEKRARVFEHSEQLKKQIAIHAEKHKQEKRGLLEEGKKMKDKLSNEKKLLENIKSNKLQQLVELEIPTKYTTELAKKRIVI